MGDTVGMVRMMCDETGAVRVNLSDTGLLIAEMARHHDGDVRDDLAAVAVSMTTTPMPEMLNLLAGVVRTLDSAGRSPSADELRRLMTVFEETLVEWEKGGGDAEG